ncbi:hypothetical protein D5018_19050 [Parashewanella curva]|uniref:Uncharacterized protein n=1 Tax=Parashewanella curva TaxID=2338552 RepID=A0A3L8PRT1_9GAMM|nr:hypothetical protein [Parashewanella curva]RLV58095.1 hypothetical protein D5018_19050 [Parashewanella curva]
MRSDQETGSLSVSNIAFAQPEILKVSFVPETIKTMMQPGVGYYVEVVPPSGTGLFCFSTNLFNDPSAERAFAIGFSGNHADVTYNTLLAKQILDAKLNQQEITVYYQRKKCVQVNTVRGTKILGVEYK